MKKFICALICVLIAFASLGNTIYAVTSENLSGNLTADEFASEVGGLLMSVNESLNLPGKVHPDCEDECTDFETARLIVKSTVNINTLNASSVIKGYDGLWILQFDNSHEAAEAYDYYSTRAGIDFVEVDKIIDFSDQTFNESNEVTAFSTKSYLSWGPEHIGIDRFNREISENSVSVNNTVVAVVDTGVDSDHPFLKDRVIPTRINTSTSGTRNNSEDDHGHGTRIAGIIADCTLNNVYIKPYKVMDKWGNGSVITVAAGINCAVRDGVDVISISIGFEENSETLRNSIRNAEENDIVVVGAAGNDASDTVYYPASYSSVIKVSAVNKDNILTNFSSYGNGVDIAAPGIDIVTTDIGGGYTTVKGTSFAAPFVASAAAAIISIEKNASSEDIINIILSSVVETDIYEGEEKYGKGFLYMPEHNHESIHNGKTETPYFSLPDAYYTNSIELEIFCDDADAEIYYTTDRSVPSKTNPSAIKYDGSPVTLSQTTVLLAVAYSKNKFRSTIANFSAFVIPYADESELTVDASGTLLSYNGSSINITIPQTVNGIEVKKIGENAFANSNIMEVVIPKTVTEIGDSAFENCQNLRTVSAMGATIIGDKAFSNCVNIRNLYFDELETIGEYAFYQAGKTQFELEERSFSLRLQKLKIIPEGAFMGSSITSVELSDIEKIERNAFSECNALVSVKANSISNLSDFVFRGCTSLTRVEITNLSYVPPGTFNTCTNLLFVRLPNVTFVNSGAFENCISLRWITLEKAETVFSNAFSGCSSLISINLPELRGFEDELMPNVSFIPAFPASLESFRAPKLEKTVSNMFYHSKNIKNIYLNSVKELAVGTFNECKDVFFLDISGINSIGKRAFGNGEIEFIDARNLKTTDDMPDNSGILLSNSFIESTDSATNLIIYGTPDTFVERYANHKGYKFIAIPLVYNKIPEYITENSETVYISAVGFDLAYQWYSNTVKSTVGGSPIKDATTNSYTFTEKDKAPYYYCIITQTDMGKVSEITTDIITKDTTPADYSAYNNAVKQAEAIDRKKYENIFILDSALNVDVSGRYSCEQDFVDAQTQAILDAISKLKTKKIKNIVLSALDTELGIFKTTKISFETDTDGIPYDKIEFYSDNMSVILVSKDGTVRCIGEGSANVHARLVNTDGSVAESTITFNCTLSPAEKIIGIIFRPIFIMAYWYGLSK